MIKSVLTLLGLVCCFAIAEDMPHPPMVVTHPTVPLAELSKAQLRSIYLKRQVIWPDGVKIKVFMLPVKSAVHQQFSQLNLQLFPYQLEQHWQKLTYSGTGTPPTEIATTEQLLQLILSTPGAIGYLPHGNEIQHAKVIQIQP